MNQVNPIAGALLGTGAGDVLGSAVEGANSATASAMVASGRLPMPGSRYTDDTQQALILARHLLSNRGIVAADLAAEFAGVAHLMRGPGPGFLAFASALGEAGSRCRAAQPSAGNGAAMRSAPLAIWCHNRPGTLPGISQAAAEVTHSDPRGVAAGVALPAAVMLAAAGLEGADLVVAAAEYAAGAERRFADGGPGPRGRPVHTVSGALVAAVPLVGSAPADLAAAVGRRAAATSASGSGSGTHPYALASVVTAIAIGAAGGDDPASVEAAVALGGDTDTVGAMVGAIVGARRGTVDWPWPVPNADLLIDIGIRLAAGGDADGLPGLADLVSL